MTDELQLPRELVAGDTWSFAIASSAFPAPEWSATLILQSAAGGFDIAATAQGAGHAFAVAAVDNQQRTPGDYYASLRFTRGAEVRTRKAGWIKVRAAPSAAAADLRTEARRLLDAVNAALLGRATSDQQSMTLNGRSISRIPLIELRQWQRELKSQVRAEDAAASGGMNPRRIRVRLGRAR